MSDARELLEQYAEGRYEVESDLLYHASPRERTAPLAFDALRAVLKRHNRCPNRECVACSGRRCRSCGGIYPCPTVRAITDALVDRGPSDDG